MLRAHLSTRHHLSRARISRPWSYSTSILDIASKPANDSPQTLAKESLSPAAIVSLVHQHIAFRTRPWELGEKQKERTALNTTHRKSAYPVSAPGFVKPLRGRSTSTGLPLKRPPRIHTSTTADLEALADDLETYAMMATNLSAEPLPRIYSRQGLRQRLLVILAHTQDAASAWAAYRSLLVLPRSSEKPRPKVPFAHRHRLLRLLAAAPPRPLRTRGQFAQVFAVVRGLLDAGATVQRWEWNLLLDCAGKEGWRHPREEHFRAALAVLAEMRVRASDGGDAGGAHTMPRTTVSENSRGSDDAAAAALEPDIFSYSTLLAHAVRTRSPTAVRHAARILVRAGLTPGAHAHTALLDFFARRGDLAGVRDTLFRIRRRHMLDDVHENEHEGEGDGGGGGSKSGGGSGLTQASFNAVLWAFAYNGRLDVARAMYRVVRVRGIIAVAAEGCVGEEEEELEELESTLAEREMIVIARDVVPDAATYHALIQAYAYQGDLHACLRMLTDMLSAPLPSSSLHHHPHPYKAKRRQYTASLVAFRAIFLGFARHGVVLSPDSPPTNEGKERQFPFQWTLPALEALFDRFLDLPPDTPLREPTLFWLVSAFMRTSGAGGSGSDGGRDDHDSSLLLRSVFERVEARFGSSALMLTRGGEGARRHGRLARIRERVFSAP
jgi:pentatricopeptide repeat protein